MTKQEKFSELLKNQDFMAKLSSGSRSADFYINLFKEHGVEVAEQERDDITKLMGGMTKLESGALSDEELEKTQKELEEICKRNQIKFQKIDDSELENISGGDDKFVTACGMAAFTVGVTALYYGTLGSAVTGFSYYLAKDDPDRKEKVKNLTKKTLITLGITTGLGALLTAAGGVALFDCPKDK